MYFLHVFYAPKITPKQSQNDFRSYRHFFRAAAVIPYRRCRPAPSPLSYRTAAAGPRRRRFFLITAAAFGSSWAKKGGGGLGFRSWVILPAPPLIKIYTPALHNYQNALSP